MNLFDKVNNEIKEAMKSRNEDRLRAFRNLKSAFLLIQSSGTEASDEAYLKAVQKQAKQLRDSIAIFEKEGRTDLAAKENDELRIVEELLPEQLGEAEIEARVRSIIAETGATGMKDLGKVMPVAMKNLSGLADGKLISEIVKRLLIS
ncbi:MAG: GatB/YqeY domain-containing protein [Flavobacteriales bacterium]|nr:GatB/YqeY domain-containing protein [Flavobacteriales bacterium]